MSSGFSLDTQLDLTAKLPRRVEELPEGNYSGKVVRSGIKNIEAKTGPATLFEIMLSIDGPTYQLTYWQLTYWLTSEPNLRRCLTSLKKIGFDTEQWGPDHARPYTVELEAAGKKLNGYVLNFRRSTSANGYPTIALESLDDSIKTLSEPVSDADLPF